ncbi:MAG: uroporphyrinogen decarboxylase family protein [Ruthenibacterium sp.]
MDKLERVRRCIAGEHLDRPPFSMWMHFHMRDRNPVTLADACLELRDMYDMDFLKITPSGLYFVQDFGAAIQFGRQEWEHPRMVNNLLQSQKDLEDLPVLNPETGALSRELTAQKILCSKKGNNSAPILMTLFTPLTVICKLIGNGDIPGTLKYFIETCPQVLHAALRKIQRMEDDFLERAFSYGIDGIFFATQAANFETLSSADQYKEFGVTYDYPIAEKIHKAGKLCLMHVCMKKVMLELFRDYPIDIINWDNIYSGTTITQARELLPDKVLAGGIDIFKIMKYTPAEVKQMVQHALDEAGGSRFILSPTCVLLASTPCENLKAISDYLKSKESA